MILHLNSVSGHNFLDSFCPVKNSPQEEKYGSSIVDPIHVIIVVHVGLYSINETRVQLLSLIKNKECLRAPENHVSDRFSQLALITNTST